MSEPEIPTAAPGVGVYAVIGRDERFLLVEHPEHDGLPGGKVPATIHVDTARDQ